MPGVFMAMTCAVCNQALTARITLVQTPAMLVPVRVQLVLLPDALRLALAVICQADVLWVLCGVFCSGPVRQPSRLLDA